MIQSHLSFMLDPRFAYMYSISNPGYIRDRAAYFEVGRPTRSPKGEVGARVGGGLTASRKNFAFSSE